MAAGNITLDDVTLELMQANVTLEKLDDNSLLMNEFLNLSIDTLKQGFGDMLEFFKGNSLAKIESDREQAEFNRDMLSALQDLKPKYTGPDKKPDPKDSDFGLGGLLTGLAIVIGTVIGVIRAQLQAIKLFASAISSIAKSIASIIPDFIKKFFKGLAPTELIASIRKTIGSFAAGLSMQFDLLKSSLMEKLSKVGKFLTGTFDDIVKFFSGESKLFSGLKSAFTTLFQPFKEIFLGLKNAFTTLFQPFKELFSMVKGLLSGPFAAVGQFFVGIGESLSKFGAMIGKVAGIVGKIFLPLTIIMTLWDTVKGAIEGFEKDGIIGGIGGAIKGFFNSLIFGPIDMIKDATAWVLGFFGFDKAKEFLNAFSFEKTFSTIIDAIMSPIDTLKNIMNSVVTFFTDVGSKISGFFTGFEIPGFSILGKQFGPWKPFSSSKTEGTATAASTEPIKGPAGKAPAVPPATTNVTAPTTGGVAGKGAVPSVSSGSTGAPVSAPADAGPNWKTTVASYKDSTPVDTLEKQYPGVASKFRELASNSKPRTDTIQSIQSHEEVLKTQALGAVQNSKVGAPAQQGMAVQSGQQLQTAAQEKGMLDAAPSRAAGSGGGGGVLQNNSTTVVNNSTVVVKPIPSASRRPNNSEDIFFGGAAAGYA